MPVTIDQMTTEVETVPQRDAAREESGEKPDRVKQHIVRAVIARLAERAARVHAD